ncbi:YD repeat-containing protein [Nonlabens dokdonensis]|jgi:YD repeat-containing protein|uniref:Uncharacterized protein n=2 Tax=Nonlabens dokdonensis TaxID=328515 RepID=L7W7K2_NONDD|nr:hypothetical protein [Nonlabens dokdonensis]AGC75756.1 hypothetical protein DDD_0629 [Nonlabens dokdonensis DSW-6]PZX43440.1 YD repeat-containing protein [Nonlabens dokdonensis]
MKIWILLSFLCGTFFVHAQSKSQAPVNPKALNYTIADLGLNGPVKKAGHLEFDDQGRLLRETGDEPKKFTYTKSSITVEKYGSIFIYKIEKDRIVSYSIKGKKEIGNYTYNNAGQLIKEKTNTGTHITYTYDDQNRLIKRTEWYGDDPYPRTFEYYGTLESLEVTITVGDDRSSRVTNRYKNGVFVNRNFQGADDWQNVVLDSHGNWVSYDNVAYGTSNSREITYYK